MKSFLNLTQLNSVFIKKINKPGVFLISGPFILQPKYLNSLLRLLKLWCQFIDKEIVSLQMQISFSLDVLVGLIALGCIQGFML